LQNLEQGRLISPNQRWSFAGAQAYTFAHSRLGDAAYSRLSQARRSAIHRQVAQWFVAHQRGSRAENYFPPAALITYHLERAGEPAQATTD
jgi:predicted ATPase